MEQLNNKQIEVINSSGPVLCIAGAGTGKTRVLTYKIYDLIKKGINPKDIYAFTFTNKAASEMKYRVAKLLNTSTEVTISTFHSFFFRELNMMADMIGFEYPISIIDSEDELKIIREIIKENDLNLLDSDTLKYISNIKNHITNKFKNTKEQDDTFLVFHKLQKKLMEYNRMDFDDILYYYYELLNKNEYYLRSMQEYFQYILIDEGQDMNLIQYEILSKLSLDSKLFLIVGDIDQCIYTFRGSNYQLIKRFQEEYKAKLIILEENYRCTKNILEAANNLIQNNYDRFDKNLFTNNDTSFKVHHFLAKTDKDESIYAINLIKKLLENGYKYSDIAILYRNNSLANNLEKELLNINIPYQLFGSYPFFSHKEIKCLINHYLWLINKDDSLALSMILNYPKQLLTSKENTELNLKLSRSNKSLYKLIEDQNLSQILNYLNNLKAKFNELNNNDFFEYLLAKTSLIKALEQEKNSKEKIARILEFKSFIEELSDENNKEKNLSEFISNIYLQNNKVDTKDLNKLSLMTIHSSKGLEFKVVITIGCNQGILPSLKINDPNKEEERRLFYVAITRARERLFLLSSQRRFLNGKQQYFAPSDFLLETNIFN